MNGLEPEAAEKVISYGNLINYINFVTRSLSRLCSQLTNPPKR